MEATQQMNVRIPAALKREGDAEFARLGLTPSEMVRHLYQYVIKHGHDREKMDELIGAGTEDAEHARERAAKLQMVESFWGELGQKRKSIGLPADAARNPDYIEWVNRNAATLANEATLERFMKRTA